MSVLEPTREAAEMEDRFSQVYIGGAFERYLAKGERFKTVDAEMKRKGYSKAGYTVGGAYMRVNYLPTETVKRLRADGAYI